MDLEYTEEYKEYRERVRDFLKGWPLLGEEAKLPEAEQATLFRERGIRAGFVCRNVPADYGGAGQAPDALKDAIVRDEFYAAGAPGDSISQGAGLLVPTLLDFGTDAQKQRFIPLAISDRERWCQGYSEPGSGSDLASLKTKGELQGDEWVINGQKIWTSLADVSTHLWLAVRTDPDARKHAGISIMIVPTETEGITIRPLHTLYGGHTNETFYDNVRVPVDSVVGGVNQGWPIVMHALNHAPAKDGSVLKSSTYP